MIKIQSKEAYYERLRSLGDVNSKKIETTRELGTLMDNKKGANGINYGIVRENQNFYIKKAGTKENPNVSDFLHIDGLANIKHYQYNSLGEADKNRNMILIMLTEAEEGMGNDTKEKIDVAVEKLDDLETATTDKDQMAAGLESEPEAEVTTEPEAEVTEPEAEVTEPEAEVTTEPEPEAEVDLEGGEEATTEPEAEVDLEGGEEDSEELRELKKDAGKLINTLREFDLTEPDIKYFVNSFLSAFEDKFQDVEIEDRKEMANTILKVVPDVEHAQLGDEMEADPNVDETSASPFLEYVVSRGYNSIDSLKEADEDEITNLVNGYANDYVDGNNEGDFEDVALIIKIINPAITDTLKNDYGHEDYVEKLQPSVDSMKDSSLDECDVKLNELFGGLKSLGKAAMSGIKKGVETVGDKIGQAATQVSQTYHSGEVDGEVKKLEKFANKLGQQVSALNTRLEKAGQEPLNTGSIVKSLANQIMMGNDANVSSTKAGMGMAAEGTDPAYIETQPNLTDNITEENELEVKDGENTGLEDIMDTKVDDVETETPEDNGQPIINDIEFAPASDTLGAGIAGINKEKTGDINIDVDGTNKTVNIQMNESEKKVRQYINRRLKEKTGLVKKSINENKKSKKMIELDKMIDKLFEHYTKK